MSSARSVLVVYLELAGGWRWMRVLDDERVEDWGDYETREEASESARSEYPRADLVTMSAPTTPGAATEAARQHPR